MENKKEKTILIVEDEVFLIRALRDKFEEESFRVIDAKNGSEGLEKALAEHPDLIVLDIIMPRMDGMEMLKKLREDEWGRNANVIILSNLSSSEKMREASAEKVYDFWVKADWTLDDLVKSVKEKIE